MAQAQDRYDGSEGPFELIRPEDFLPADRMPLADRRLGLDRWSGDAGLIVFAASLDPTKTWHRVTAWVLLALLSLPFLLIMWRLLG